MLILKSKNFIIADKNKIKKFYSNYKNISYENRQFAFFFLHINNHGNPIKKINLN